MKMPLEIDRDEDDMAERAGDGGSQDQNFAGGDAAAAAAAAVEFEPVGPEKVIRFVLVSKCAQIITAAEAVDSDRAY